MKETNNIQERKAHLTWQRDRCVHCTACVGQCLNGSFTVDPHSFEVIFNAAQCVSCGRCIPACPYGALEEDNHG